MRRAAALAAGTALAACAYAADPSLAAFSALDAGQPPPGAWRDVRLTGLNPPEFALVRDAGVTVLRVRSAAAAGSLVHRVDVDPKASPRLPLATRAKVQIARLLHGNDMPVAAICYVWDNRQAPGTMRANSHVANVRMVVLRSGPAAAGTWMDESRDIDADFRAAFAGVTTQPMPRIVGVAVGNDTDQTGETVTAWFGDLRLEAKR